MYLHRTFAAKKVRSVSLRDGYGTRINAKVRKALATRDNLALNSTMVSAQGPSKGIVVMGNRLPDTVH